MGVKKTMILHAFFFLAPLDRRKRKNTYGQGRRENSKATGKKRGQPASEASRKFSGCNVMKSIIYSRKVTIQQLTFYMCTCKLLTIYILKENKTI